MLKAGLSQQDRQKKRLSFKDPEIEEEVGHQRQHTARPRGGNLRKDTLTLEDQAFHIAHNVGSAFSDLTLQETSIDTDYFDAPAISADDIEDSKAEALINDCFLTDPSYQRKYQQQNLRVSSKVQEFSNDSSPPLQIPSMRCPPIEGNDHVSRPRILPALAEFPLGAQHQIQLLRYQLDQQGQHTRHVAQHLELLTDQLGAESAARSKAQEQNNQLMLQNQELLSHIERLFQQVEELEKQIQVYERSSKIPHIQEPQSTQYRPRAAYTGNRRLSSDTALEKPPLLEPGNISTRRGSFTNTKPSPPQQQKPGNNPPKLTLSPPQRNPTNKPAIASGRMATNSNDTRAKETLHIGDMSPPVQSDSASPFEAGWKTTKPEPDKSRSRTGSFGSFSKLKPPENVNPKSSSTSASGITTKKYSSSTSDLYSNTGPYQVSKPIVLDESASSKTVVGNTAASKLPRFQPYTGSSRRSSLTKDFDQFSMLGKDKFKTAPQTSFFNR